MGSTFHSKLTQALTSMSHLVEWHDDGHCTSSKEIADDAADNVAEVIRRWQSGEEPGPYHVPYDPIDVKTASGRTVAASVVINIKPGHELKQPYEIEGDCNWDEDGDAATVVLTVSINAQQQKWPDAFSSDLRDTIYMVLEHEITHPQSTTTDKEAYLRHGAGSYAKYAKQGREWESNINALRRYHKYIKRIETLQDLDVALMKLSPSVHKVYTGSKNMARRLVKSLHKAGIKVKLD